MRAITAVFGAGSALACLVAWAAADWADAGDPPGLERFPGARIVAYEPSAPVRSYEFVTGRVDRIHRDVRIDDSLRLPADLLRITYRAPDGARLDDVVAHYRNEVGSQSRIAFTCRGRDCGRSTIWANDVFRVKELVAPDSAQFYLAALLGADGSGRSRLAAIYVVQRGNRRVYAHVDFARTAAEIQHDAAGVAENLSQRGYAVLTDAAPDRDGVLAGDDLDALDALAGALTAFAGETLYVVCHLSGEPDAEQSLARSADCAERAAARLRAAGVEVAGFGGGALLPRRGAPLDRLELVLPRRVREAEPVR